MIARITIFAILVLTLATYASSPAATSSAQGTSSAMCCDGDPGTPPSQ
jgi:hypothetical protein